MIINFLTLLNLMGSRWRTSFYLLILVSFFVSLIDAATIVIFALASSGQKLPILKAEISTEFAALFFIFLSAIIRGLLQYLQIKFSFLSAVTLGKKIFSQYLESTRVSSYKINDNQIISSITGRLNTISGNIILASLQIFNLIFYSFILVTGLIYFAIFNVVFALLGLLVIFALIYLIIKPITKILGNKINQANTQIVKKLNETTQTWQLIRVRMQEKTVIDSYSELETDFRKNMANVGFLTTLPRFGIEIIVAISLGFLILVNSKYGDMDLIDFIIFGYAALRTIPMVQQGYNGVTLMTSGHPSLIEVLEILKQFDAEQPSKINRINNLDALRSIEIRNLTSNRIAGSQKKPVSLKLKKGEKLVILGSSGSGKSTILDILMGLVAVDGDKVLYNGKCINYLNLQSVYKQIAYLPQVAPLVNGTVRENMLSGINVNYDDKLFNDLLVLMGFTFANDEIDHSFLDRSVGDRGKNLSGGQRQRVQLLNTLITNKKTLILDEATSALDENMEKKVMKYILDQNDLTVVAVTHKNTLSPLFNKVINLKK